MTEQGTRKQAEQLLQKYISAIQGPQDGFGGWRTEEQESSEIKEATDKIMVPLMRGLSGVKNV